VNKNPAQADSVDPIPASAARSSVPPNQASASVVTPKGVQGAGAGSESQPDTSGLVLIADPEPESAKATANALSSWGLQPILAHDGVEAILNIQRALPKVVILDAALPKMFGFQVCELMKRNESLREITVVLIGAIHHRDRYRRPPSELYGADAYIERHELPDALYPILADLGLPVTGQSATPPAKGLPAPIPGETTAGPLGTPAAAPPAIPLAKAFLPPASPTIDEAPTSEFKTPSFDQPRSPGPAVAETPNEPAATPAASVAGETSDDLAQAERLARIIVSDIVLYNQDKFDASIKAGNVVEAMHAEMGEARGLFAQRVDSTVREVKDFLTEELIRVARKRGMK
jgi:CheY-like chemotaxis protein